MIDGNDIWLEEDQWLIWVDISNPYKDAQEIDSVILPAENFWKQIELHPAPECGLDAFDFSSNSIKDAIKIDEADALYDLFDEMKSKVQSCKSNILMSTRFNQPFHKDFFVELLEHILGNLDVMRIK